MAEHGRRRHLVLPRNLERFLGVRKFHQESDIGESEVGVATGLAWTPAGGELLHIEVTIMKGRGNLSLTGHLGDVMKESAQAALSYARSQAGALDIPEKLFADHDLHIHVPAGAIPKDGPSAGITITTALVSALTGRPVSREMAMTGEVTLRGRVLPVGGLKEKVLAAHRAGIRSIILPEQNQKDLAEIPADISRSMRFIFATCMDDVLKAALLPRPKKTGLCPQPGRKAAPRRPSSKRRR